MADRIEPRASERSASWSSGRKRRRFAAALGAAAALCVLVARSLGTWSPSTREDVAAALDVASSPLATVGAVTTNSRAASVERCDSSGCSPVRGGDVLLAGQAVRVSHAAQVRLALAGGGMVVLDRASTLRFAPGLLALERGVADVDLGDASWRVEVPGAAALGGPAAIVARALGGTSTLEVHRGTVTLIRDGNPSGQLRVGEVYSVGADGRDRRGVVARAAQSTGDHDSGADALARGLGQLRALVPGSDEERAGAVRLKRHRVDVRIADAFARVTIDETFENLTDESLEGLFRFALPSHVSLDRLALEVDGRLEEGVFVERERARAIWRGARVAAGGARPVREDVVWVPGPWQDPALLEWQRGGRFELRIQPIPRRGSRRVVLSYTQVLPPVADARRLAVPLPMLPMGERALDEFGIVLEVRGHDRGAEVVAHGYELTRESVGDPERWRFERSAFRPTGDLLVDVATRGDVPRLTAWSYDHRPATSGGATPSAVPGVKTGARETPEATTEGAYTALALRPEWPAAGASEPVSVALVVDSSWSMQGEARRRAVELVRRLVESLGDGDEVTLLACDHRCRTLGVPRSPRRLDDEEVRRFFAESPARGASDLARAFSEGARSLTGDGSRPRHVVYLGDGVPTAGPLRPATLRAALEDELARPVSLSAIAIGGDAERDGLDAVVRWGGGVRVDHGPGGSLAEAVGRVVGFIRGVALSDVSIELPPHAYDLTPSRVGALLPGDEVIVAARHPGERLAGEVVVRGRAGGRPIELHTPIDVSARPDDRNAFVAKLYASLRVRDLEAEGTEAARGRAVRLSRAFAVSSRHTSLLVLESPVMMRAFGLASAPGTPNWEGDEDVVRSEPVAEAPKPDEDLRPDTGDRAGEPRMGESPSPASPPASRAAGASSGYGERRAVAKAAPAPMGAGGDLEVGEFASPPEDHLGFLKKPKGRPSEPQLDMSDFARRPHLVMRVVWERIVRASTVLPVVPTVELDDAEARLARGPLSRDLLARAVSLSLAVGRLGRARELVDDWIAHDPLDIDALRLRAEVSAADGRRDEACSEFASALEIAPGDVALLSRIAESSRALAEDELACRIAFSIADSSPREVARLSEAVGCARSRRMRSLERALLEGVDPLMRARILPDAPPPVPVAVGELVLEATWDGDVDLDLALVDQQGRRVSVLGAPAGAVVRVRKATERRKEMFAVTAARSGSYRLELVRVSGVGAARGTVKVSGPRGPVAHLPFVVSGARADVGSVELRWHRRLDPATDAWRLRDQRPN